MDDQKYVSQFIQPNLWKVLVGAVIFGYRIVNTMDLAIFGEFSRELQALGYHCAVQSALQLAVARGNLPGNAEVKPNSSLSAVHLEWNFNDVILSVSQVHHYSELPRRAEFRNRLGRYNLGRSPYRQLDLFGNTPAQALNNHCYFLLTHGHQGDSPSFIGLGVPDESVQTWYALIDLLQLVSATELPSFSEIPSEEVSGEVEVQLRTILEKDDGKTR